MKVLAEKNIIKILKNIPIFQNLPVEELKRILPLLEPRIYNSDSLIIKEGASGNSMHIIVKGTVKVTKMDKDGEEILLGYLYSGSYFGEFSLIDRMPRSANVKSTVETHTLRLSKDALDSLLNQDSSIAYVFYKNCLGETFSRFRNIISNFTFSQHLLKEKSVELDEINKDLLSARRIQRYFINTDYLDSEDHIVQYSKHSYIYNPCIDIGGDFLNIYEIDENNMGIIIADFMGHGISAALGTGVLRSALSSFFYSYYDKPLKLMKKLNTHFLEVIPKLYATCYYAHLDFKNGKIKMAKAGHPHPIFWKTDESDFLEFDCTGAGLGFLKDASFGEVEFSFKSGDKILFYTDGIIEEHNENHEMYSPERLENNFRELIKSGEENILNHLMVDVRAHSNKESFEDDITMFLLEL